MNIINRLCPICSYSEKRLLFKHDLVLPEGTLDLCGYEVVVCGNCGFLFADRTASQNTSDIHYAGENKTTNELSISREPDRDILRLNNTFNIINRRLNLDDSRILDIGCGTGYLLSLLKNAGVKNLVGIDQSVVAASIGIERYNVNIEVSNVFDLYGETFDCILICHVFEHIVDIDAFISIIYKLLSTSGTVYIEVPDALQFEKFIDPLKLESSVYVPDLFTHFTPEHVNFFTPISLRNLMTRFGFDELFCESDPLGVVISAWKPKPPVVDHDGACCLRRYITESELLLDSARVRIKSMTKDWATLLVWGVGLHTQRLLARGDLSSLNIIAFVDSASDYKNRYLSGIKIIPPEDIGTIFGQPPILVSSYKAQNSIVETIKTLKLPNEVLTLY